jgi:enterochelin esterase family protein
MKAQVLGLLLAVSVGCTQSPGSASSQGQAMAFLPDRATSTATADISLLDQLKQDLGVLSPGDVPARIQTFLASVAFQGGTPLVSHDGSGRVAFFVQGPPTVGYAVSGSFNGWSTSSAPAMTQLGQSGIYAVELDGLLTDAGVVTYKLLDGTTFFEDFYAQNVVWDGFDHGAPGQFNAVANAAQLDPHKGRIVAWRGFQDNTLNLTRDVFIYVPAVYDSATVPYLPVLYFSDGNESLTRSPFSIPSDAEYAAHPQEAALQVYVALPNQDIRISQYSFDAGVWNSGAHGLQVPPPPQGDLYTSFLTDELRPQIDTSFRTCQAAKDRGIAGASLGGLIALYAGFERPDMFGFVGSQSGSVFWGDNALTGYFQNSPVLPLNFYIDTGCPDDNCYANEPFEQALVSRGYPVTYVEQDGGQHDWPYWQQRLPGLLHAFRPTGQPCGPTP